MSRPSSPKRAGADLRLLRAAVFTAVCVALSAAGHVLASCESVPMWSLGLAALTVFGVTLPLAGRRRSLPGIAAVLAAGQLVLHGVFGYAQQLGQQQETAASTADASLVAQAARLVCGVGAAPLSPTEAYRVLASAGLDPQGAPAAVHTHAPAAATQGLDTLLPSPPMLLGHLLAALVAGWLLRRGDLALLRAAELSAHGAQGVAEAALVRALRGALSLVRALRSGLPGAPECGPRPPLAHRSAAPPPQRPALHHSVIRRGPPVTADPCVPYAAPRYALAA
ncbi:hypothetical protein [Streptomyces sp. GC420]|uniref:hypothetical protein n=1 Tax=Streptomyces sp. GC420 TaxID=2697568 RepID=UPI001414D862|nr:hypothetical protein [Streptomyces sp. GC420]NBM20306.1 hypothetical protein [Streptomyces sp. GC420]